MPIIKQSVHFPFSLELLCKNIYITNLHYKTRSGKVCVMFFVQLRLRRDENGDAFSCSFLSVVLFIPLFQSACRYPHLPLHLRHFRGTSNTTWISVISIAWAQKNKFDEQKNRKRTKKHHQRTSSSNITTRDLRDSPALVYSDLKNYRFNACNTIIFFIHSLTIDTNGQMQIQTF